MEEARAAIQHLLELHPMDGVRWRRQHRLSLENDAEYLIAGARLAGLPE